MSNKLKPLDEGLGGITDAATSAVPGLMGAAQSSISPTMEQALHLTDAEQLELLKANEEYAQKMGAEYPDRLGLTTKPKDPGRPTEIQHALDGAVLTKADQNQNPEMMNKFASPQAIAHTPDGTFGLISDHHNGESHYFSETHKQNIDPQPCPPSQLDMKKALGAMYLGVDPGLSPESAATYQKFGARLLQHDKIADLTPQTLAETAEGFRAMFPRALIKKLNTGGPQQSEVNAPPQ
jgi:hypothetical protein